jgi:hypothetical protein
MTAAEGAAERRRKARVAHKATPSSTVKRVKRVKPSNAVGGRGICLGQKQPHEWLKASYTSSLRTHTLVA